MPGIEGTYQSVNQGVFGPKVSADDMIQAGQEKAAVKKEAELDKAADSLKNAIDKGSEQTATTRVRDNKTTKSEKKSPAHRVQEASEKTGAKRDNKRVERENTLAGESEARTGGLLQSRALLSIRNNLGDQTNEDDILELIKNTIKKNRFDDPSPALVDEVLDFLTKTTTDDQQQALTGIKRRYEEENRSQIEHDKQAYEPAIEYQKKQLGETFTFFAISSKTPILEEGANPYQVLVGLKKVIGSDEKVREAIDKFITDLGKIMRDTNVDRVFFDRTIKSIRLFQNVKMTGKGFQAKMPYIAKLAAPLPEENTSTAA